MDEEYGMSQNDILGASPKTLSFTEVLTSDCVSIDVRSPKEFLEGSLPGAINIPVFDNEERELVGTIYRFGGRDEAIDTGFDLVTSRLSTLLAELEPYRGERIAVFCARGGMRSRSVVNLLNLKGYDAIQVEGGYKAYRQLVLKELELYSAECIVLHGLTGTGKTRILQYLDNVIDLEDLAQHQSSLFGGLNRSPRTQKSFDSYLFAKIVTLDKGPVFVEGESRKMGGVFLPKGVADSMKRGHHVLVTASVETRVSRILEDYPVEDEQTVEKIEAILNSMRRKLGHGLVDRMIVLLSHGNLAELVRLLLVEYYDKRYGNSMARNMFELELSSEDIPLTAEKLLNYRNSLLR